MIQPMRFCFAVALVTLSLLVLAPFAAAAGERKPIAGRTLVFSRTQMKYGLERNYLRGWLDRPLFQDSSLAVGKRKYATPYASFKRTLENVAMCGIDGFALFPETSGRIGAYGFTERARVPGVRLLTEFVGSDRMPTAKDKALAAALACPASCRVKGKLLITSYRGDSWKPEKWRKVLADLRRDHGDRFLFLPAMARGSHALRDEFDRHGRVSPATLAAFQQHLRAYLDVCDGVHFSSASHVIAAGRRFNTAFYRRALIPAFMGVLSEPKYRGKLLSLSACVAHFNTEAAQVLLEHGTKSLRHSFEAALEARPDVIVLPEWDEENENTCFRPTVYSGLTTQRVLKFYMSRLKGEAPTPNPGDDVSIPNLIVSYRKTLVLGEALAVELLNVPDGAFRGSYDVTLSLKDIRGRVVKRLPVHRFAADRLEEKTHVVATETLADHQAVIPSLTIKTSKGERAFEGGLLHARLRSTWNWDYKEIKQPLRDVCRPKRAEFAMVKRPDAGGRVALAGSFEGDEPIASAEVLDEGGVVYAADPDNTYFLDSDDTVLLNVEVRQLKCGWLRGRVRVLGAKAKWPVPYREPGPYRRLEGDALRFRWLIGGSVQGAYVGVARAEARKAVLEVEMQGRPSFRVPVSLVLSEGIYCETRGRGFTLAVSRFEWPPTHPRHLGVPSVRLKARVRPRTRASVFHMRVVTKSGKVWRSKPLALPDASSGPPVVVSARSDVTGRVVRMEVAGKRAPRIEYELTSACGSVLRTSAGRAFWGILGGYTSTVAAWGGNRHGSEMPFRFGVRNYPKAAKRSAPTWVKEDGRTCLKFDGSGNFILLPSETVPLRAGFRLAFEIKPTSRKPQVLFTHHGYYIGSVTVRLKDGRLSGQYTAATPKPPYYATRKLEPGLRVPLGEWSKVEIVHDQATMRFRVNGKDSRPMPCPGPGLYLGRGVFGGFGAGKDVDNVGAAGWFKGYLRALSVDHALAE